MENNVPLPTETEHFSGAVEKSSQPLLNPELKKEIDLRLNDIQWKLESRKRYGFRIFFLLCLQNFVVFGLVVCVLIFAKENLKDMQLVLTVLLPATLLETAFMVKILVQWLFSDINYKI